jgi:molybdopterin-guanine dinucleotide biosynthesis protein A
MRVLGAIIAGGQSRRFGSDKALAVIDGRPMIAHVTEALRPQVEMVAICGRDWPGLLALPDLREGRIGALAGLEAALHHAAIHGFDAVLSVPVDVLPLPDDLMARLRGRAPAVLRHQHLIGWWPVTCRPLLGEHLSRGNRAVRSWIAAAGARTVDEPFPIRNLNHPADLATLLSAAPSLPRAA